MGEITHSVASSGWALQPMNAGARPRSMAPSNETEAAMSEWSAGASSASTRVEEYETVVIGGGQAGLATGYWLSRLGRPFVILDAGEEIGESWRRRWDSMRLFTPA